MHKRLDIGGVLPENALVVATFTQVDLFHAIQGFEEGTPELVAAILAIGQTMNTAVLLELNNVANGLVLNRGQFFWLR